MICLKIRKTKEFMHKFLMTEAFEDFLTVEAAVTTFVSYTIDGHIRKDFYTKEEQEKQALFPYAEWEALRPQVLQMVKGKNTPLFMKLTLAYKPDKAEGYDKTFVKDLLCTVKYENGCITLTSGISYQGFTMEKEPEKFWDLSLCRLLDRMELEYEIM